jgi:tetratricopeptide (TPR) repeat protein
VNPGNKKLSAFLDAILSNDRFFLDGCKRIFLVPTRYHKPLGLLLLLFFSQFLTTNATAQGTITALEKKLKRLRATKDIRCFRYADLKEASEVRVGMALSIGDELRKSEGDITLEVKCSSGSLLKFSGPFRVVFLASNGQDCAINLLNGSADVLTSQPTTVTSGPAKLATKRTQYSVEVYRTDDGPAQDWSVYEGEVEIQLGSLERRLDAGKKLVIRGRESPLSKEIEPLDISRAANIYARLDVSEAADPSGDQRQTFYAELQALHRSVLSNPKDVQARISLAQREIDRHRYTQAALNLSLTEGLVNAEDHRQLAIIAAMKGTAYSRSGRFTEANEAYLRAYYLDPSRAPSKRDADTAAAIPASRPPFATNSKPESRQPRSSSPAPSAPSLEEQQYLLDLIRRERYQEAIDGFQQRLRLLGPNAKDSYGLALAYSGLGDTRRAAESARQALERNKIDHSLSEQEEHAAEKIAATANK